MTSHSEVARNTGMDVHHHRPNAGTRDLPLFESGYLPPHHKGSDTSREAARSVAEDAPTQRSEVYGYILARGQAGATDAEIERGLSMLRQSVCARRNELVRLGMIRDSGRRRTAPHTGRLCAVWVVVKGQTKD